jgi:hypothetical protein
MPRLLAAISPHGFGHAMQTCLVLNALRSLRPETELILRTQVAESFLASRLSAAFTLERAADDFGMLMHSAVCVNAAASCAQYSAFHRNWAQRVDALAAHLRTLGVDLLFSDVPYLPLAAARRAGIPSVALCSLNWADIHRHYCADQRIQSEILDAYRSARVFLRPAPAMPMPDLSNTRAIGPLAQLGRNRREEILQRLGAYAARHLVLVGLGGIEMPVPMRDWPRDPDIFWLVPENWRIQRADCLAWESLRMPFTDVLRSVDALLTKPGYGSFSEAACNGVAVVYVEREDWPESAYLEAWLKEHTPCLRISQAQLAAGDFFAPLRALCAQARPAPPRPDGAEEAARVLAEYLPPTA